MCRKCRYVSSACPGPWWPSSQSGRSQSEAACPYSSHSIIVRRDTPADSAACTRGTPARRRWQMASAVAAVSFVGWPRETLGSASNASGIRTDRLAAASADPGGVVRGVELEPAPDDDVAEARLQFDRRDAATHQLRGHDRAAAAGKRVEDQVPAAGRVAEHPPD